MKLQDLLLAVLLSMSVLMVGCRSDPELTFTSTLSSQLTQSVVSGGSSQSDESKTFSALPRELREDEYDAAKLLELVTRATEKPFTSSWVMIESVIKNTKSSSYYTVAFYQVIEGKKWQGQSLIVDNVVEKDPEKLTWKFTPYINENDLKILDIDEWASWLQLSSQKTWYSKESNGRIVLEIRNGLVVIPETFPGRITSKYVFDVADETLVQYDYEFFASTLSSTEQSFNFVYSEEMELPPAATANQESLPSSGK